MISIELPNAAFALCEKWAKIETTSQLVNVNLIMSMLHALDAPKTLYRLDPHISRLKMLLVAIVQSGAEKSKTWYSRTPV